MTKKYKISIKCNKIMPHHQTSFIQDKTSNKNVFMIFIFWKMSGKMEWEKKKSAPKRTNEAKAWRKSIFRYLCKMSVALTISRLPYPPNPSKTLLHNMWHLRPHCTPHPKYEIVWASDKLHKKTLKEISPEVDELGPNPSYSLLFRGLSWIFWVFNFWFF